MISLQPPERDERLLKALVRLASNEDWKLLVANWLEPAFEEERNQLMVETDETVLRVRQGSALALHTLIRSTKNAHAMARKAASRAETYPGRPAHLQHL